MKSEPQSENRTMQAANQNREAIATGLRQFLPHPRCKNLLNSPVR